MDDIEMCQHRALWAPGRARGVEDDGDGLLFDGDGRGECLSGLSECGEVVGNFGCSTDGKAMLQMIERTGLRNLRVYIMVVN